VAESEHIKRIRELMDCEFDKILREPVDAFRSKRHDDGATKRAFKEVLGRSSLSRPKGSDPEPDFGHRSSLTRAPIVSLHQKAAPLIETACKSGAFRATAHPHEANSITVTRPKEGAQELIEQSLEVVRRMEKAQKGVRHDAE